MHERMSAIEPVIFLNPGEFCFYVPQPGKPPPVRLHTLLGSCVSVVLWHPEKRIAGMSHGIMPDRGAKARTGGPDGRYCNEAIELFQREVTKLSLSPQQFSAYIVGGGVMYALDSQATSVGNRNMEVTRDLVQRAGFNLRGEHAGALGYRKLAIDLATGVVSVQHNQLWCCLP